MLKQQPHAYKIDLQDLVNSQIDWAKYQPSKPTALRPKKQLRPHQTNAQAHDPEIDRTAAVANSARNTKTGIVVAVASLLTSTNFLP